MGVSYMDVSDAFEHLPYAKHRCVDKLDTYTEPTFRRCLSVPYVLPPSPRASSTLKERVVGDVTVKVISQTAREPVAKVEVKSSFFTSKPDKCSSSKPSSEPVVRATVLRDAGNNQSTNMPGTPPAAVRRQASVPVPCAPAQVTRRASAPLRGVQEEASRGRSWTPPIPYPPASAQGRGNVCTGSIGSFPRHNSAPIDVPVEVVSRPRSLRSPANRGAAALPGVEILSMEYPGHVFDPMAKDFQRQLFSAVGVSSGAQIEVTKSHRGGQNEGIWFIHCAGMKSLVLKLVTATSRHPSVPTEAENIIRLAKEHPQIISDCSLAFPYKIIHLHGQQAAKQYDLIVMRKAVGVQLQDIFSNKLYEGRLTGLLPILEAVGSSLAAFHKRYGGMQHCDMNAANIIYDEHDEQVTFIDLGGMGDPFVFAKDIDGPPKSIRLLTKHLKDPGLTSQLVHAFQMAYHKAIEKS